MRLGFCVIDYGNVLIRYEHFRHRVVMWKRRCCATIAVVIFHRRCLKLQIALSASKKDRLSIVDIV
uniref:Uncharacterized protein n=1 Tax=Parascaris univalens TaxID=6257 RepID=A0A915CHI6_PARUN